MVLPAPSGPSRATDRPHRRRARRKYPSPRWTARPIVRAVVPSGSRCHNVRNIRRWRPRRRVHSPARTTLRTVSGLQPRGRSEATREPIGPSSRALSTRCCRRAAWRWTTAPFARTQCSTSAQKASSRSSDGRPSNLIDRSRQRPPARDWNWEKPPQARSVARSRRTHEAASRSCPT